MGNKIQCEAHGECEETFVCSHLSGGTSGLGFNRDEPSEQNSFPDAWCDNCELIRAAHDGRNEESDKLATILLLCSECYEWARIRNTRTSVTLDDLSGFRWKCGSCEEWHSGPCLDFSFDSPYYWQKEYETANSDDCLLPGHATELPATFLDDDFCAIESRDFFIHGLIHLPIIGSTETFRWGVWGSVSRENFETLLELIDDPKRAELAPMFSWLSTQIDGYPDTLSLKMYAHIQDPGCRPTFELEQTDHQLSQENCHGITAERVREIMISRLPGNQ